MAEKLHYILNILWARKLNHKIDCRHVNPITDSQTVQALICTNTMGQDTNSKLCLRNTALILVSQTAL